MADQGEGFALPVITIAFQPIGQSSFTLAHFNQDSYNSGYIAGFAAGSVIALPPEITSAIAISAINAGGPIFGLTPTWLGYFDAETGASQASPSITEVGGGNYKFTPGGTNPAGIIDLGSTAVPRYLIFSSVSRAKVFAAFDLDRAPLVGLTPVWVSLKKVSDNSDYTPQPVISTLGAGLYKTDWTSDHTVGVIDLGASAYPRYYEYDSELTAQFLDGYAEGELFGFSSQKDEAVHYIKPGETNALRKTITFMLYDSSGLPASGNVGEGAVVSPAASELQVNKNLGGYNNFTGTFAHIADGKYRYEFHDNEVSGATEGYVLLRLKKTGFRTNTQEVVLRFVAVDSVGSAAVTSIVGTPAGASVSADIAAVKSDTASTVSTVGGIQTTVTELKKIGVGRWRIIGNQLIIYDTNGTTPLYTFDLLDDNQAPSMTKIFERLPVP